MKYEKSMKEIFNELKGWKEKLADLQRDLFLTMTGINDDIGFTLSNRDFDHAEFLQNVFDDLSMITDCQIPQTMKWLNHTLHTIAKQMQDNKKR